MSVNRNGPNCVVRSNSRTPGLNITRTSHCVLLFVSWNAVIKHEVQQFDDLTFNTARQVCQGWSSESADISAFSKKKRKTMSKCPVLFENKHRCLMEERSELLLSAVGMPRAECTPECRRETLSSLHSSVCLYCYKGCFIELLGSFCILTDCQPLL